MGDTAIGGETKILENQSYGKLVLDASQKDPKPVNSDYKFDGWYKESAYTTKWSFETDLLNAENVTLYAKWTQYKFNVSGTVNDSAKNPVPGADVELRQGNNVIE